MAEASAKFDAQDHESAPPSSCEFGVGVFFARRAWLSAAPVQVPYCRRGSPLVRGETTAVSTAVRRGRWGNHLV